LRPTKSWNQVFNVWCDFTFFFLSCYHKIQRKRERETIYKWDMNGKRPIEEEKKMEKATRGRC
jgi:hypothetical protein